MRVNYRRKFHTKAFFIFEAVSVVIGLAGMLAGGLTGYSTLILPPFTMPAAAFSAVWAAMYLITGCAAYIAWNAYDIDGAKILRLYLFQLILSAAWPLIFFRLNMRLLSFFWAVLLIAIVTLVMTGFKYIRKASYRLMFPYLLWLLYIAYLNFGTYLLNQPA